MKIALNALQAGNRSGTGRYAAALAEWLPRLAPETMAPSAWPADIPPPPGAPVEPVDLSGWGMRMRWDLWRFPRRARGLDADLMHYPANFGPIRAGMPYVVTVHDLSFFRHPEWFRASRARYYRAAARWTARGAARIIADSQCTAGDVAAYLGFPEDRIDVAHLGVDAMFQPQPAAELERVRRAYRLPEPCFLYVGTLEPRKNLVRLVQAFEQIAGDCPHALVLAGRDGWKNEALHRAIEQSPVRDRISLPGFIAQDDLPAVLSAADVFVWPSLWEGFGLPPLEAMACGVPVVASSASCLPEVAGDAALLPDPEDPAAIAAAMVRLAQGPAVREEYAARGRARAAQFTWEKTAAACLKTYAAALRSGAAAS